MCRTFTGFLYTRGAAWPVPVGHVCLNESIHDAGWVDVFVSKYILVLRVVMNYYYRCRYEFINSSNFKNKRRIYKNTCVFLRL